MKKKISRIIFWIAISFIGLTSFSFTVGQELNYEFADFEIQHKYYEIIITGLPIAILLTLLGTLKRENSKTKNWLLGSTTFVAAVLSVICQIFMLTAFGFGAWTTETILYKHKTENRVIEKQLFDIGAFGYGGQRIVEIKPFLKIWILPIKVDTMTINKEEWRFVNEEGDIKFP